MTPPLPQVLWGHMSSSGWTWCGCVEVWYLPGLGLRQLQDGQVALHIQAGEEAAPLFLKVDQVLPKHRAHAILFLATSYLNLNQKKVSAIFKVH